MGEQTRNLSVALRPETFSDYIGNSKAVEQIRTLLDSGRVPTAIMLSGPTGAGKTTFLRCLNQRLDGELIESNAADDTGVDAARALGESAQHKPLMGDYKVFGIDEAHQLTKQAQNALLKHVEDAPPSSIWVLATTEPAKIIPTLRGRCIQISLAVLTPAEVGQLVVRGLRFLGWKGNNESLKTFTDTLVREGVTSPRAILMATERFFGGLEPLAAALGSSDAPEAFKIAQAASRCDWKSVSAALSNASNEEAMAIRAVTVNYFKSMLLKASPATGFAAAAILQLTATPFTGPLELAELSARLYTICKATTL